MDVREDPSWVDLLHVGAWVNCTAKPSLEASRSTPG
jgi:hypothetical protein